MKEEEHLLVVIYGGLREAIGIKTYLHGPMDYAKTLLKLRFRVRDLDLPKRRKRYSDTSSQGKEEEDTPMWPFGKTVE